MSTDGHNGTFNVSLCRRMFTLLLFFSALSATSCVAKPVRVEAFVPVKLRAVVSGNSYNSHMNNGHYLTIADLLLIEYFMRCGSGRTMEQRDGVAALS